MIHTNDDVILIAEIGWNHGGDMKIAKKMIQYAAKSGANYAKFQTWSVSRLKPGEWDMDGRRQIYKQAELSKENHIELISYCNKYKIKFMSSVFSIPDAELLVELGVVDVKIPSFESRNKELIDFCDSNFENVFMSTGTSSLDEVIRSVKNVHKSNFHLLHCVSSYPGKYEEANIRRMDVFRALPFKIGYSDHIPGIESAIVAIGVGASVIEKHFTIDNDLPGRDNKFAILPREMKRLKIFIENRKKMMIYHGKGYLECEINQRENYTGRFNG